MPENKLEPLPTKELYREKNTVPFPYRELSRPVPQVQEKDRLRQLEQMLSEKQDHVAIVEREAYDKAYAIGEKSGMALGGKRAEQILVQMQQTLDESKNQLEAIQRTASEAIVEMSGVITEWIIGKITTDEQSRLYAMAEKAAHLLPEMEESKFAIHPDDFAQFKKLLTDSKNPTPLLSDPNMTPGSIRVFNKNQDMLVDPVAAVAKAITQLKLELHKENETGTP